MHTFQVHNFATKYFGGWAPTTQPVTSATAAAPAKPSAAGGSFEATSAGGPGLMTAFYRPAVASPDAVILEVIG